MFASDKLSIHRSENNNLTRLYLGEHITIWFSYDTPVAFAVNGLGTVKSENIWSKTTGRHLDTIPAREVLDHDEFTKRLDKLTSQINTGVKRIGAAARAKRGA